GRCLKQQRDGTNVVLRVVAEADGGGEPRILKRAREVRVGLAQDEREDVGRVGRCVVLAYRGPVPADLYDDVANWLRDDPRLAFGEGRVLDERELYERVFRAPWPTAEEFFDLLEHVRRRHVARDHDGRVVRH